MVVADRHVIASVSGGKDSAAMSLWLTEQGIEHERVFMDTGWEHEDTYTYLRGDLTKMLGPITEIRGDLLMADLVRRKGMFPSRTRRFCTESLKVKPIMRYIAAAQDRGLDVVNAVGIRAAESEARKRLTEWEWSESFDCDVWRPLIAWTEEMVIEIHARHGLRPNPLYLRGASRVGCWPCIFARKNEIRNVAESDPARIDLIRALEAESQASAQARYEARGETFESLGYNRPTFFQAMGSLRTEGGKDGRCVPIDEAVAWSKTSHGGKQLEMFTSGAEGCVRWGLCETEPDHSPVPEEK
jgi:3'-phosphoadenosine 5'-phosphosulfate sulfotransferase (PAPS reductase)/FAD synthetase